MFLSEIVKDSYIGSLVGLAIMDVEWKLNIVKTPQNVPDSLHIELPLLEIQDKLNEEFREYSSWTKYYSGILKKNITMLFLYDRFEYFVSRVYGANYKIMLNPMMLLCYHPVCLSKNRKPWKFKHIMNITWYLKHLKDHSDEIGMAMQ